MQERAYSWMGVPGCLNGFSVEEPSISNTSIQSVLWSYGRKYINFPPALQALVFQTSGIMFLFQ